MLYKVLFSNLVGINCTMTIVFLVQVNLKVTESHELITIGSQILFDCVIRQSIRTTKVSLNKEPLTVLLLIFPL